MMLPNWRRVWRTSLVVWPICAVVGCETYDSVTRSFRANWKGQPVRSFAEYRSLVPASHHGAGVHIQHKGASW
jgi:hypothetical protein